MMDGHVEQGTCALCGKEVTSKPIIFAMYLTCNIADDGREGHTREELQDYYLNGRKPR